MFVCAGVVVGGDPISGAFLIVNDNESYINCYILHGEYIVIFCLFYILLYFARCIYLVVVFLASPI